MGVCSKGSTCENTAGGYKCVCPKGFCFNPRFGCEGMWGILKKLENSASFLISKVFCSVFVAWWSWSCTMNFIIIIETFSLFSLFMAFCVYFVVANYRILPGESNRPVPGQIHRYSVICSRVDWIPLFLLRNQRMLSEAMPSWISVQKYNWWLQMLLSGRI